MDLQYSDADREFRAKARAWLAIHVPRERRAAHGAEAAAFDRAWQRKQYEHGWAGVAWP
ncbi:MAG: acyl-CoA dehydrogenase, partial [Oxalobacteraceae bacterium]